MQTTPWPRLLSQYNLHRTNTGRLSSGVDKTDIEKVGEKKQQLQNTPKAMRDIFVADPGWVMIGADWAAIQFALIMRRAALVNEPHGYHQNLLERQQAGQLDPHRFLAEAYTKVVTDEIRQLMKGYTYGRAFKGAPDTLGHEQGHPLEIARGICDAHDKTYKLQPWWDSEMDFVIKHRFVETAAGWRRYFFDTPQKNAKGEWTKPKPQEVMASAIQGDEGDLLKRKLCDIAEDIGPDFRTPWLEVLTTTHDSILIQTLEDRQEEGVKWLVGHMESPVQFLGNRGYRCSVKVGRTWKSVS